MRPLNQDTEMLNPEPPVIAPDLENAADEAAILADQDETQIASPASEDPWMGGDGVEDFGVGSGDFAHGEVDVKEQMDRTMAAQDAAVHRPRDRNITPHSADGVVDRVEAIRSGMQRH